jgi:drug/metabolite transporter (DMT)-like permease
MAAASSAPDRATAGIALAVLGFALFSTMDVLVKWLSADYPLHQIVFVNALMALVPVGVMVVHAGGLAVLRTRRLPLHLLRSLCTMAAVFGGFYAFSRMPLADVYAIIFTAPLLITALAVPVLGEEVGWRRWTAICVGFGGVLIMLRPGAGVLDPGAFAALATAAGFAVSVLIMRVLSATESTAAILLYPNLVMLAVAGSMTAAHGILPGPLDLARFAAAGLLGAGGFLCMIAAYRRAPAAIAAPFQYSQMLWGTLYGYAIWGDVPGLGVLAGAVVVIGSGLFILYRETRLAGGLEPARAPTRHPAAYAPTRPATPGEPEPPR